MSFTGHESGRVGLTPVSTVLSTAKGDPNLGPQVCHISKGDVWWRGPKGVYDVGKGSSGGLGGRGPEINH